MSPQVDKVFFRSGKIRIAGNKYKPESQNNVGVLFLHGGGESNKERYKAIQTMLYENDFTSLSFDFRGVGESEGILAESTLEERLEDASNAYAFLSQYVGEIVVVGTSMGAHVAARLASLKPTSGLIFLYGAAYASEAENKKFNSEFTITLHKEGSWKTSPVFTILSEYQNPIFIAYGENDKIIPPEIQAKYHQSLKPVDTFLKLSNASHVLLNAQDRYEEEARDELFSKLLHFLKNIKSS